MHLKWTDEASLRRLAEEGVTGDAMERNARARAEPQLYDLLVHKAELEMQNEALRDAQAELACAHERYKILFENAPMAYIVLDASCRMTAVNGRAAELFGATPGDLVGVRVTRFLIPEAAISFERYRRAVMESFAALRAEFKMVAGGEQREVRLESFSRNRDGKEWYVALTDVTEHKGTVPRLDRPEVERPPILDLNTVLAELRGLLPALMGDDIMVDVHLGALDGDVRLSRMHVEQILLTAARNARHAMPHGGSFRIETANTESAGGEGTAGDAITRFVRWTLSDTGVGMTDTARGRAFEPFFTTEQLALGSDLGLLMVKAAVERSGGFVRLESELGRGSMLVIHLPRTTGRSSD
jgi:PAS domain S-box-containing protein